ncbi:hypothetical protein V1280_008739 [Bradyrhizobium sp. AZCC 2230]
MVGTFKESDDQILAMRPPSIRTVEPVMYDARGLARKVTTSAYSCGSPYRPTGIDPVLSTAISLIDRPSRSALAPSSRRMRSVAMRPGKTMLQVTPSRPTSRASVFDQPTRDIRSALDSPRFAIGETTPDDVLVMILPKPRRRIPGRTRSVIDTTDKTMLSKCLHQSAASCPCAGVGGGPPVLFTSTSTDPSSFSIRAT